MAGKRNIILLGCLLVLTISYWGSSSLLIGDKPFEIKVLEQEQQELNENLISAQILASQLDRVFTLFQENLALSKADSLADDASLPFLNNLTDMLEDLDIKLLGIKPKPRIDKITYFKAPYIITLECSYEQFGVHKGAPRGCWVARRGPGAPARTERGVTPGTERLGKRA